MAARLGHGASTARISLGTLVDTLAGTAHSVECRIARLGLFTRLGLAQQRQGYQREE
jgi:hypothetical protein